MQETEDQVQVNVQDSPEANVQVTYGHERLRNHHHHENAQVTPQGKPQANHPRPNQHDQETRLLLPDLNEATDEATYEETA